MKKTTKSEKETIEFGKSFAKKLKGGEVILLIGDLGAGKTTFVKGVAKALDIKKTVTSPTFVIMKIYEIKGKRKKIKVERLVHIDTYRGLDRNDLEAIGAFEYLGQKEAVCFVEWGEGLEKYLKRKDIKVYIIKIGNIDDNKRSIDVLIDKK